MINVPFIKKIEGFSLLELMVVLLILGIVLSTTSLSISRNDGRELNREAKRLASLLRLAREEAILRNTSIAIHLTDKNYEFFKHEDQKWSPIIDDNLFRKREFAIPNLLVTSNLEKIGNEIRIIFGLEPISIPFHLTLSSAELKVSLISNGLGQFTIY